MARDPNLDSPPADERALLCPQCLRALRCPCSESGFESEFAWLDERAALIASLPSVEERTAIRKQWGVSVSEMSRRWGVSRDYVRLYERGGTVPTGRRLRALVAFYKAARHGAEIQS